ncbi:MAG: MBL fold metallo-hydrolase, partial [Firmicutes bacterium]|nr:MBL fold metallo-hydrolase [Bacillota bacterium]
KLGTNDMGRVIAPGGNQKLIRFVGYFMAVMLFTVLVTMTAAGGALFYQQFGLNRILGGLLIAFLVIITVLGEFERVSHVFRYIMPVLSGVVVITSLMVSILSLKPTEVAQTVEPSPMAPNWFLAALLYISYNILALVPMVATASVSARSDRDAVGGTALGGAFLGLLAFLLLTALQQDMPYSQALDMPMLGYAGRLSPAMATLYGVVLFCAIYSSATSNFYGFTTKLKDGPQKSRNVIIAVILGFLLGLVGFKNVVAFMFPMEGFLGFVIIAMLILNFFQIRNAEKKRRVSDDCHMKTEESDIFQDFEHHDRTAYPAPLVRVTGGKGGEALLIRGPEKTCLYDAGMACFAEKLIENIDHVLKEENRRLDLVILSHTHYDHIGGLPYILERWPEAQVCASEKAKKVFESSGARNTMKKLGEYAAGNYGIDGKSIMVNPLRVDRILHDGDRIDLGTTKNGQRSWIEVLETKGHTDCALTYLLQPEKILFTCESTGVLVSPEISDVSALKNFDETMRVAERLKKTDFRILISPHYGVVPAWFNDRYFDLYIEAAGKEKAFIRNLVEQGKSMDEILEAHRQEYWKTGRSDAQPYAAYRMNTEAEVKQIMTEYARMDSSGKI